MNKYTCNVQYLIGFNIKTSSTGSKLYTHLFNLSTKVITDYKRKNSL